MKTIAVDFDGVLHAYSRGWEDGVLYDDPKPGAAAALRSLAQRYRVVVFTARDLRAWGDPIRAWLAQHGMADSVADVTNVKPPAAFYIDDRAIRFESWPQALGAVEALEPSDGWRPVL